MKTTDRIFIAGHRGMVGSALVRQLKSQGYCNLVTQTRSQLDLMNQQAVNDFFSKHEIDVVLLAAAKVGGIHANNTLPADFIYQNLMIEANVIHAAYKAGIRSLLFLGSSCIYPKQCPQPMKEEQLLSGYLEPTNEPYAIAKIAGIKLCESYNRQYGTRFRVVMPTNLYGPGDNYDLQHSHVLPAMIRKFYLAKLAWNNDMDGIRRDEMRMGTISEDFSQALQEQPPLVKLWGTGAARREFLHVDDMAAACLFVMQMTDDQYFDSFNAGPDSSGAGMDAVSFLNVGSGEEVTMRQLAEMIRLEIGFSGEILWDESKPDGTMRKLLDTSRLNDAGWRPQIDLKEGIQRTCQEYRILIGR